MSLRVPPQAVAAEQAVLGGVMLSPDAFARVADKLVESDFYRRDHALIWRAICDLDAASKPFDAVTMADWFAAQGRAEEVQGGAYLIELASTTPSAANVVTYAEIVRDKATRRRLIDVATQAASNAFGGDMDTPGLLDGAIRDLMALSKQEARCEYTLKQAASLAWQDAAEAHEHRGQIRGVTTGFSGMDRKLGGWHRGDLIFIGARPSVGKTAFAVNLALNAARQGHSVGFISGEQSAMQVGQRSISAESGVHAERLRNGDIDDEAWPRLTAAVSRLVERKVRIYDRSAPRLDEIARVARRWKQENEIAVLFVDYLQRIRCKAESRIEEVSEVARGLKTLARDLDIPLVCLAQVKAEVDKRDDKRPGLGDIANSDEATREADLIAFLYRDDVYHDGSPDAGIAEVNVEKYRHGPTGSFRLKFFGETMKFADLAGGPDW